MPTKSKTSTAKTSTTSRAKHAAPGTRPWLVVGIDFSPSNELALAAAIRAAKQWDARIAMVHAISPLGAPGLAPSRPRVDAAHNESADMTAGAAKLRQNPIGLWRARVKAAGVEVAWVSRPGNPARVLMEEATARHAKAIVVGHQGGAIHGMLGSVSDRLVETSKIPVIVVPAA